MIGTAACQRVDVAMIIFESLLVILQQRDVLLEAIASLLWIRRQGSYPASLSKNGVIPNLYQYITGELLMILWVHSRQGHVKVLAKRETATWQGSFTAP